MPLPMRFQLVLSALLLVSPVQAQVFDGGSPDGVNGHPINNGSRVADDFVLSTSTTLTAGRFWALQSLHAPSPLFTGTVFWEILASSGGAIGASVAAGSSSATETERTSGPIVTGYRSFQYDFAFGAPTLAAGVYYLALSVSSLGNGFPSTNIYWETAADNGTGDGYRQPPSGAWHPLPYDYAFQLYGPESTVTPEPATMLLLGSGLAGIGALRRRRRLREIES